MTFTRPYSRGSESKAKEKEREGPSCPRMELGTQAAAKEAAACSPEARSAHSRRFDGDRSAAPQTENTHGSGDGAPPGHLSRRPARHRPSPLASGSDPISLTLRCLASQLQRPVFFEAFLQVRRDRAQGRWYPRPPCNCGLHKVPRTHCLTRSPNASMRQALFLSLADK